MMEKDKFDDLKYWQKRTLEFQEYLKTDKKIDKETLHRFEKQMKKFFKKQKLEK